MNDSLLLELNGISKDYGSLRALTDVSFSIGRGVTGLLGPNGAGKTTMIKILLGLVKVTAGTGSVLGHALGTQARAIRNQVGYMPEDDCYVPGLTGVEMVQFAARLSGQPAIEGLQRAHEILDFCAIEQERYRKVDTYSTGMRQKLKFAQSIVHDPPLLILDEPTAGLDPEERHAMLNRIALLAKDAGKAVILSTHILPDVQEVCDQVIILVGGRLQLIETLEVLSKPASPEFQLRTLGQDDELIKLIEASGAKVRREDDGTLTVITDHTEIADKVWSWAREAGVGVRSFVPSRNSLEQIFMDAVREAPSADA